MIGHHAVDHARLEPAPQRLPVDRVPDRRARLEFGGAVPHLFRREGQGVRARLRGPPHAGPPPPAAARPTHPPRPRTARGPSTARPPPRAFPRAPSPRWWAAVS